MIFLRTLLFSCLPNWTRNSTFHVYLSYLDIIVWNPLKHFFMFSTSCHIITSRPTDRPTTCQHNMIGKSKEFSSSKAMLLMNNILELNIVFLLINNIFYKISLIIIIIHWRPLLALTIFLASFSIYWWCYLVIYFDKESVSHLKFPVLGFFGLVLECECPVKPTYLLAVRLVYRSSV